MFDFHALSSKEISIKKHDIVIVKRAINHNWVEIEDPESGLKVFWSTFISQSIELELVDRLID